MRKLNFEQSYPATRETDGLSAVALLMIAIVLCAIWGVLLHAGA